MFQTEQDERRERLAGEVRAELARRQITAAALGAQIGSPAATLSRKLNGKTGFTIDELIAIGRVLEIPVVDLLRAADAA